MDGVDGLYYAELPGSAGRSPPQRGGQGQTLWMLIVGDSLSVHSAKMCLEGKFKPLASLWFRAGDQRQGGRVADRACNEIWDHWSCSCLPKGLVEGTSIKAAHWFSGVMAPSRTHSS